MIVADDERLRVALEKLLQTEGDKKQDNAERARSMRKKYSSLTHRDEGLMFEQMCKRASLMHAD
jgi:hypothetical protein